MKKSKKLFIVLALTALLVAALCASAFAAEVVDSGQCGENVYWELDSDGMLTISGTGKMWNWNILDYIYAPWDNHRSDIKSINISNSVTTIGSSAFSHCTSLTSVTIPNSVTTIGDYAFYNCTSLTSVTIPNSVTTIGDNAFAVCTSLTGIWVDENNPNYSNDSFGVLFNKNKSELIQATGTITVYTIPDSVTTIGECAFYRCTSLTSVTIPDSVTTIGSYAFWGCTSLTSVTIPNSVTTIGGSAFWCCTSLTSVTIPNSVTTIGNYAFFECTSLTSVTIPDSVTTIGNATFEYCTSLTSVTIPNSVTTIGNYAFFECTSLTSVTIPNSVTTIGRRAFYECTSLTSVTIPNSVTTIGDFAFEDCTSLTSVTIPDSVTTIGESTFKYCTSLTSVTIPDSVTTIGYIAFYECTSLKDVYYSGTEEQWNKIEIDGGNKCLTDATIHYNSTGTDINNIIDSLLSLSSTEYNHELAVVSAELSRATYVGENDSGIKNELESLGFNVNDDRRFYSNNYGGSLAFTTATKEYIGSGSDGNTDIMVIAAQGSTNLYELFQDSFSDHSKEFNGYYAYDIVKDFYRDINDGITRLTREGKKYIYLVTGHSLGGAAANLTAAVLTSQHDSGNVFCYTFGAIDSIHTDNLVTDGYENIHNVYNDFDTFSPTQYGGIMTNEAGRKYGKFGVMETFAKDYRSESDKSKADIVQIIDAVNHAMDNYLKAVNDGEPERFRGVPFTRYACIACPVNVEVFDGNVRLATVFDDVPIISDRAKDRINIIVEDDMKYVQFCDDLQYQIYITAYDEGTMVYYTYDTATSAVVMKTDVYLTEGKRFHSAVGGDLDQSKVSLDVVDKNDSPILKVLSDGSELPFTSYVNGDVNIDNTITNTDLVLLARYIVGLENFTEAQKIMADMDGDEVVNNTDLVTVARIIVGL